MPAGLGGTTRPRLVTGDQIASDALRYRGQGYSYGGPAARPGDWDCSSFVSYVLGHDLGMGLPGGKWGGPGMPPGSHGPVVTSYASWGGAVTVNAPARGDLVCFVGSGTSGHIGIVLGPNQMVSALDSASGTLVTPITGYGPPGAPIVYRRVLGAAAGSAVGAVTGAIGGAAGGQQGAAPMLVALLLLGGMAAVVVAGALAVGGAVAFGLVWLAGKGAQ